jgi:hypothetical protein
VKSRLEMKIFLSLSKTLLVVVALFSAMIFSACTPDEATTDEESSTTPDTDTGPFIYVASGTTYAGAAVTMSTPSQTIARYKIDGTFKSVIRDYTLSAGDTPVAMADYNSTQLMVLVENTAGRRIELVKKDGSGNTTFITNATALSGIVRDLLIAPDGGILVSKSTAVEKFSSSGARITIAGNPYINAPAGACATATTLIPHMAIGPSDSIFMLHAAASPNNQIDIINSAGYAAGADCLGALDGPTATHYPTAILYHSSGKMLVSYGNNVGPIHQIYSYTASSTSLTLPVQAYNNSSVMQGPSHMVELANGDVLVAASASTFNSIERFSFNSTTGVMTRVGTTSFISPSVFTRSISAMVISAQ